MKNKFEDLFYLLLILLGSATILLFSQVISLKSTLDDIESEYYKTHENVMSMVSENEKVLLELKANETHDYYDYDSFTDTFRDLNYKIEELAR